MGALWSPPGSPHRHQARRRPESGKRTWLAGTATTFGCLVALGLALCGLVVLGTLVAAAIGSIRLFPNK